MEPQAGSIQSETRARPALATQGTFRPADSSRTECALAAEFTHDRRQIVGKAFRATRREVTLIDEVDADERCGIDADVGVAQPIRRLLQDVVELLLHGPEVAIA